MDIVKYNGTSSPQNISHSLNAVPAFMIVKNILTNNTDWFVYHKDVSANKYLVLNSNGGGLTGNFAWNN